MNFNIRKDANGIEVFSPLPHKIIMLMPIFQFFHKNKPSIKSTYLGFVLFSGRQIQRFAVGEILWSIYTEIIPGEEPSRVVTVLGRGLRGTLWTLLQFYCHVIFSSAGGTDYLAILGILFIVLTMVSGRQFCASTKRRVARHGEIGRWWWPSVLELCRITSGIIW